MCVAGCLLVMLAGLTVGDSTCCCNGALCVHVWHAICQHTSPSCPDKSRYREYQCLAQRDMQHRSPPPSLSWPDEVAHVAQAPCWPVLSAQAAAASACTQQLAAEETIKEP